MSGTNPAQQTPEQAVAAVAAAQSANAVASSNPEPLYVGQPNGNLQWIRRCSLLVANDSQALDLSQLRIRFRITQSDIQTPNTLTARVYNPKAATVAQVEQEFTRVILQAGYQNGPFGVIFQGTIKQTRWGRESPVDTYLDILAADADVAYNQAVTSTSLAAGASQTDQAAAIAQPMAAQGVTTGYMGDTAGGTLPRGKVLYGMSRDLLRTNAATNGMTWSIQNGVLQMIPLTGYLPGEAVVLNAATGMIGMPEQTQEGIRVTCLINPKLRIGGLVQIANKDIQTATRKIDNATLSMSPDDYTSFARFARISGDGFYRVYVVEAAGDTRGNDWYQSLICLSVDMSAPAGQQVSADG